MEFAFVVVDNELDYYIDLFIKIKAATKKPATITWYKNVLGYYREAVTGCFASTWPPTLAHCLAFLETFKTKGLTDSSRNNYYRALRSWLNWLKRANLIDQNPIDLLDPIPAPKPLPKAPPEEEMDSLFEAIKKAMDSWRDRRDLALFSVALDTGARPGELARMTLDHVNPISWQIRVYSDKDKQDRELVLGDDAAIVLAGWLDCRRELGVPEGERSLWVSDYQQKGWRQFTHWGIRQRLRFWQEKAKVEGFTPYAIRHAFAIYSLRNNADLLDIRDQMGHASITTTAIYTQVVNKGRNERQRKTSPLSNLKKKPTSF